MVMFPGFMAGMDVTVGFVGDGPDQVDLYSGGGVVQVFTLKLLLFYRNSEMLGLFYRNSEMLGFCLIQFYKRKSRKGMGGENTLKGSKTLHRLTVKVWIWRLI